MLKSTASYAASSAASGGPKSVLNDLVDFLENNVDSFDSYDTNDALEEILKSTDVKVVLAETEETQSIVSQLSKKADTIQTDLASAKSSLEKLKSAPYNSAKIEKEIDLTSIIASLEAKEKVVKGHLKRSRKRLVSLQERSKELLRERRSTRSSSSSSSPSPSQPPTPSPTPTPSQTPSYRNYLDDKKRLAALKVKEELDKLKRDLGL